MVKPQHRGEAGLRQVRRRLHRDIGIGIGRIADHQHLNAALGDVVQRLALHLEDLGIGGEQIAPLHARPARTRADKNADVDVLERRIRVIGRFYPRQQRESAVIRAP